MSVRLFDLHDYSDILEIYAHSKLDELSSEHHHFTLIPLDKDQKRLSGLMSCEKYVFDDNGVLGFGAMYRESAHVSGVEVDECEIRGLFVRPEFRGQGIGKALLEAMLLSAPGRVSLDVVRSNAQAIRLYHAYDFQTVNTFWGEYNGFPVQVNKMHYHLTR